MSTQAVAGVRFPLDCATTGAFAPASGTAKLEQNIRLVLLTYPGERVMRPEFGSRLRDFLFDAATPATVVAIAAEVEQAVNAGEPRVQVDLVEVLPDPSVDGLLHLTIHYRRRDTGEPQELVVDFATDRHPDLVEPAPGPAGAVA